MSADFFTRLITAQVQGPNLLAPSDDDKEAGCTKWYVCPICEESYKSKHRAEDCCPREVEYYYVCNICEADYDTESEAAACCFREGNGILQPMKCPVCLRSAASYEIAADCCLHVHPTLTAYGRQRVAAAVAAGTPWDQALVENINH